MTAQAVLTGRWRTDPPPEEIDLGGIRALRFRSGVAADDARRLTMVHFHGGGFRQGCPDLMGPYAHALARACGIDVICPAYPLAPDHPFPAGLRDAVTAVAALIAAEPGSGLILAGDSAGGGIAASTARLCVDDGVSLAGMVLHSPWLDVTVSSDCFETNAKTDTLFSPEAAREAAGFYLQGHDARDTLASPLLGEVSGLPPVFLSWGSGEVLACDSRAYRTRLEDEGIPVAHCEVDGMQHVSVTLGFDLVGSQQVFDETVAFIRSLPEPPAR